MRHQTASDGRLIHILAPAFVSFPFLSLSVVLFIDHGVKNSLAFVSRIRIDLLSLPEFGPNLRFKLVVSDSL